MDKTLIEKYKQEMLNMQRRSQNTPAPQMPTQMQPQPQIQPTPPPPEKPPLADGEGRLNAAVTAIRQLYPVANAKVTVFEGDIDNMQVIDTAFTDQSGKTRDFVLPTPEKSLSLESDNLQLPYALYGMLVQADGYVDNIHLNIPVFSGVTSMQGSDMMLLETSGIDKGPRIFDELQQFTL